MTLKLRTENTSSSKSPTDVSNVNIDKIVISEEFPSAKKSTKYFSGYKNNQEVTPWCVFLPKFSGYIKHLYDIRSCVSSLLKNTMKYE